MSMHYLRRSIDPANQYCRWIDPRLRTLHVADVIAYLLAQGWKELPPDRKGLFAFQEPTGEQVDGQPVCQFVPAVEQSDDYAVRMFELLTGLAEFENRQASAVIDAIQQHAINSRPNGMAQSLGADARAVDK
jgi:hypothetical protein